MLSKGIWILFYRKWVGFLVSKLYDQYNILGGLVEQ